MEGRGWSVCDKPLAAWTWEEIYDWFRDEGVWTCSDGDLYDLTTDEMRVEVALQAEAMEMRLCGIDAVLIDHRGYGAEFTLLSDTEA